MMMTRTHRTIFKYIVAVIFISLIPIFAQSSQAIAQSKDQEISSIVNFLSKNVTSDGMPLSYRAPHGYWESIHHPVNEVDAVIERLLATYGLSLYDGALWQIVQAQNGHLELANAHTQRLLSGRSGDLSNIRASDGFHYSGKSLSPGEAYFFRLISDQYNQTDPLDGKTALEGFPNWPNLHHEDWRPVSGENSWAAILGPLQVAHVRYGSDIPLGSDEVKLAASILPAVELLQSPTGGIYYAPEGTYGVKPSFIATENNISMYAALRMLKEVIGDKDPRLKKRIENLMSGIERYLREIAYDRKKGYFVQGGHYENGKFSAASKFAVDCQTWALIILRAEWIDARFGAGSAFKLWQITKNRSGFFDDLDPGVIRGVGYTDGHDILSGEWSYGAIRAVKETAKFYHRTNPDRERQLIHDAANMAQGIESLKVTDPDALGSYKYSNKRYYIVFGWWANPIPSVASTAWAYFDKTGFNPFILGGGEDFKKDRR